MSEESPKKQYEVGYQRPPLHTRFAKGTSGNPRGARPKKERARTRLQLWEDLLLMLEETVPLTVGGKQKQVSKHEVFLRSVFSSAVGGDRHARQLFVGLVNQAIEGHTAAKPELIGLVERFERSLAANQSIPSNEDIKLFNKYRRKTRGKD
jgi:hypothetical protein